VRDLSCRCGTAAEATCRGLLFRQLANGCLGVELTGIEPVTSRMPFLRPRNPGGADKGLTESPPNACTSACTSEGENANANSLESLAAALLALPAADRARLAVMLTAQGEGNRGTP
jgi:hypothetical protein